MNANKATRLQFFALAVVLGAASLLSAQAASTREPAAHSGPTSPSGSPAPILLWPHGAPGAIGTTALDKPTIFAYLPASNPTRTVVVICPGGGYRKIVMHTAVEAARWLNARGVAAYVLVYRHGPRYHYPAPLLDAQRAIRYVRFHAAENGIDPNHIGVWGFSAGGHLAATTGTHFNAGNANAADPIERVGSRPDFLILAYAVISMQPGITNTVSLHMLLGDQPNPMLENELSNELMVTQRTPPTFLYSTTDDTVVPVINSVLFYEALVRSGVPAEIHVFERGHHGSRLGQGNPQLRMWPVLLQNWLHLHGWMASGATSPAIPAALPARQ